MKKKIAIGIGLISLVLVLFITLSHFVHPKNHGVVDYKLFLSAQEKRPMVVAFGGSEGGMVYADKETQILRDSILTLGYHFLAVGYFGTPNTPKELDRISLDAIYDTIKSVSQQPMVDQGRIAVFGGSRGGELVLNLASRFNEIDAVIAILPPNVSLPSRWGWGETASWSFKQEEIPWISASEESLDLINNGDFYGGFSRMIENQKAIIESEIKVERINAPILFISASQDEVWPSTLMCNRMVERLEGNNFQHFYEHIELKGGHAEFTRNHGLILAFLKQHFPIKNR
ncbi:acyl-CoA thioester hydrolase/BAAT C-terminal domain-containing protein [Cyclobacterium salsum]|uniref:acyl-CoA thioester hydrolase/BAAT C-terminal domain-containing protein n=1 Tax=Cyclobacterium salsum TaxID=2666329 RepID=UPI0013920537|nr:acyl-CoA thioester hydrolase/BAAT C-terminal domain-containing protein [Cyclobacterium salsum]